MKKVLLIVLTTMTLTALGQDKYNKINYNKLQEVDGTEFVIASIENWGKMNEMKSRYLLFINTKNGETTQVDFPNDAELEKIEQIKIDSLAINLIVVSVRTVDLDGKNGIDWNDPTQIMILSPDGKEKTQLTEKNYFVRNWTINKFSGTIILTGHYDLNNNNKYDDKDYNQIQIYNLKTLKLIGKI